MFQNLTPTACAAAVAVALLSGAPADAADFMTEKEMLAVFPGSTVYGVSNQDGKTRWIQAYGKGRKKGKIAGVFGDDKYDAEWRVKKGQWCEDWGKGWKCWNFERVGQKKFRVHADGKPSSNLWTQK